MRSINRLNERELMEKYREGIKGGLNCLPKDCEQIISFAKKLGALTIVLEKLRRIKKKSKKKSKEK